MTDTEHILWESTPAAAFTEAYPVGNGALGGMVWGDARCLRIGLNRDDLWSGFRKDVSGDWNRADFFAARELAMAGKYREAQQLLEKTYCKYDCSTYMTLGDLWMEREGGGETAEYRRSLSLSDGVAEEAYTQGGVSCFSRVFASFPDRCIAVLWRTGAPQDATVRLTSPLGEDVRCEGGTITLRGRAPAVCDRQKSRDSFPAGAPSHESVRFCIRLQVVTDGVCRPAEAGDSLLLTGATQTFLYLSAATSFADGFESGNPGYDREPERVLCALSAFPYEELYRRHLADHHRLYDRVRLHFEGGSPDDLPTSQRIRRFAAGEEDVSLLTLLFNYGRYLLIASSRPGSRPANLQGIWNDKTDPPWGSDYTVNINTEMNYWAALATGCGELLEPVETLLRQIAEQGSATARDLYGAGGYCLHHNTDIFAHTTPVHGQVQWAIFPVAAGWMLRELYRKYTFTDDTEYLRSVYSLFEGCARFFLDMLTDDGHYLIFAPGTSPENGYKEGENRVTLARSSTMFASIVREVLEEFVTASHTLGVRSADVDRAEAALPRLLPLRLTADGRVEEWYFGDCPPAGSTTANGPDCLPLVTPVEAEVHHRHISHLYDLYPARAITPKTPALWEAARRTLAVRGDQASGWSLGWKICCYARLGDGEGVMRLMRAFLRPIPSDETRTMSGGGVYQNLFCAHPPFQIDGNFAFTAGICEMLLDDDGETLRPLPALPQELGSGYVEGLYATHGRRVDIRWSDGRVTDFRVYPAEEATPAGV